MVVGGLCGSGKWPTSLLSSAQLVCPNKHTQGAQDQGATRLTPSTGCAYVAASNGTSLFAAPTSHSSVAPVDRGAVWSKLNALMVPLAYA